MSKETDLTDDLLEVAEQKTSTGRRIKIGVEAVALAIPLLGFVYLLAAGMANIPSVAIVIALMLVSYYAYRQRTWAYALLFVFGLVLVLTPPSLIMLLTMAAGVLYLLVSVPNLILAVLGYVKTSRREDHTSNLSE